jgi:hypothetical protein
MILAGASFMNDQQQDRRNGHNRFIKALMYILVSLTLALTYCGGGASPDTSGAGRTGGISGVNGKKPVLRIISITPSNPLEINVGTRLQFAAVGSFSDNSMQDLTTLAVWTSADTLIATISNAPDSKGQAIAISRGYCSISAMLGNISGSTIIGVK